jgi:CRP-like cAMP-binding protein
MLMLEKCCLYAVARLYCNMMDDIHTKGIQDLILSGKLRKIKRGKMIHSSEQMPAINLVTSGYIRRYRVDSNEGESVQLIYEPGDIFPLTPLFKQLIGLNINQGPETYYYSALVDCEYYALDMDKFIKAFEKNPDLYKEMLYICGKRIQTSIERLENLSLQNSHRRVAHYLARMARQSGKELPRGILIRLPVTQKDLAENLGLKQNTVARAVRHLRQEELNTGRGQMVVINLEKLERFAN